MFLLFFATVAEKDMSFSTRELLSNPVVLAQISSQLATIVLVNYLEENNLVKKRGIFWFNTKKGQRVQSESSMPVSWTC